MPPLRHVYFDDHFGGNLPAGDYCPGWPTSLPTTKAEPGGPEQNDGGQRSGKQVQLQLRYAVLSGELLEELVSYGLAPCVDTIDLGSQGLYRLLERKSPASRTQQDVPAQSPVGTDVAVVPQPSPLASRCTTAASPSTRGSRMWRRMPRRPTTTPTCRTSS